MTMKMKMKMMMKRKKGEMYTEDKRVKQQGTEFTYC